MKLFSSSSSSALVVFSVASALPQFTAAKPTFVVRIPNGANVPNVLAVGHIDPEGSSRETNAFGNDFQKAGKKWTVALCQLDSDGDGQTNGQELGDPCCEWVATTNEVLRWSDGVSDPGVKAMTSSAKLLASVSCSGDNTASVTTTAPSATSKSPTSSSTSSSSSSSAPVTSTSSSAPASASASPPSTNSTVKATTTPSSSSSPAKTPVTTTVPTPTSAAADHSLAFASFATLCGVAIAAIQA